jgi:hypothetical protein
VQRIAAMAIGGFFLFKTFLSLFHSFQLPTNVSSGGGIGLHLLPHPPMAAVTENWAQGYYRSVHTYYESKYPKLTLSSAAVAGVSSLSVGSLLGTPPVGFRSVVGRPLSFFVGVSVATFMVFCIKILLQTAREEMKRRALMVEATEGLDVSLMDSALYAAKSEVSWPEDSEDGSTLQKASADRSPSPTPSMSFRSLLKPQPAETAQRTGTSLSLKSQVNSHLGPSTMAVNLPKADVAVIDVSTDVSARDSTSKDEGVKKHSHLKSQEIESPMRDLERSSLQRQNPGEPMIVLLSVMSCLWDGVFQNQTARNSTVITKVCVESSRESAGKPLMYRANYQRFIKPRDAGTSHQLSLQKYDAVGTIVHSLLEQSTIDPNTSREKLDPFGQLLDAVEFTPPRGVQPYDAFGNLVMSISEGADTLSNGTPLSALLSSANENVTVINYAYCPVSQLLTHRDWLVTDWAGVGSQSSESKVAGKYDPVGLLIREWADSTSDGTTSGMSVSHYDPIGQLLASKSPPVYEELPYIKYDPISTLLKSFSQHSWDRHERNKYDPVGCILAEARDIKAPSLDDSNGAAWDPVWWLLRGWAGRWVKED